MAQRTLVRGSIAVAAACTLVSGFACAAAPAAAADTPTETVIPAAPGYVPRGDLVAFAGPGGFLHKPQGHTGYVWTKYSGGADTPVTGAGNYYGHGYSVAGSDVVATPVGSTVQLQDMDAGTTTTIVRPAGQNYVGTFGTHVLTYAGGTATPLHILSAAGGQQTDTPVTGWPAGASFFGVLTGDANAVLVKYNDSTGGRLALLNLNNGQLTSVFDPMDSTSATVIGVLTDKYIAWYDTAASRPLLHLLKRSDPTTPETTLQVPSPSLPNLTQARVWQLGIAGDSLLISYSVYHSGPHTEDDYTGYPLYALPLTGGSLTTVFDHMSIDSLQTDPNGVLAVGGSSVTDWAARQVTPAADGTLTTTVVDSYPAPPPPIEGLSLAGGQLFTIEQDSSPDSDAYTRMVRLGSPPSYGAHTAFGNTAVYSDCHTAAGCAPPIGTGDGRISQLSANANGDRVTVQGPNANGIDTVTPGTTGGTLVDSDGRYVVYDSSATHKQYIGDTTLSSSHASSDVLFTRPITGAALSGETLWTANSTPGSLSSMDLATHQTTKTINTGAPCVPSELQAAGGRWIYWSCGTSGPAGVYDLATNKAIAVPSSGPTQLGDGYLVEHDTTRGKLVLTDVHTDAAVTSDLADLPAGPLADDRRVTWAVDTYGGGVAYADAQESIHLLDPHIPASPASGYRLLPGQHLTPGASLSSGSMKLVMQSDGNLVAYLKAGGSAAPAEWSSGTYGHPGAYAVMQPDGNLVVYSHNGGPGIGGALWSSGTSGNAGAHAVLQDDGNLVVYRQGTTAPGGALWASRSYARPQTITSGQVLKAGWWTQGTRTTLVMQPDGNLVMYRKRDGAGIWSTGTSGQVGAYAMLQSDGNLVVYRKGGGPSTGGALWSTGTWGHSQAWAWMQDDGNLVIYPRTATTIDAAGALWASNTSKTAS
ncbi:hypothetical protein ACWGCW_07250 [Streptomyces sp. NPDC054933]